MLCFIPFLRENGMIWRREKGRGQYVNMTGQHQLQCMAIGGPGALGQPALSPKSLSPVKDLAQEADLENAVIRPQLMEDRSVKDKEKSQKFVI